MGAEKEGIEVNKTNTNTGQAIEKVLKLVFTSHGVKTAQTKDHFYLPKSDLFIDARSVVDGSKGAGAGATGDDPKMQAYVAQLSPMSVQGAIGQVREAIARIPDRRSDRVDPYDEPFVITCLCAHGIHRSRSMKNILAKRFLADGFNVEVK